MTGRPGVLSGAGVSARADNPGVRVTHDMIQLKSIGYNGIRPIALSGTGHALLTGRFSEGGRRA